MPDGQALDSYLEHVAEANHLRTADLTRLITTTTDTIRFLMLTPSERTLDALHEVTGLPRDQLRDATLAQYDGTLLDLTGLEHHRPSSYRALSAKGWLPGNGTQICPRCLCGTGAWQLSWRLPTTTVCLRHRVYLVSSCPACGKPFRSSRHNPLRPIGNASICGNARRTRGEHCTLDLTSVHAPSADRECIDRQTRHDGAVEKGTTTVLGEERTIRDYTRSLLSVTTLLLHISTAAVDRRPLPFWARRLNLEQKRSTSGRAPRWGITPPEDTRLRSRALTAAGRVLSAPDLDHAAAELSAWTDLVPPSPDGFLGWVGDHARPDPTLTRIVVAAHAPRRRLSRTLDGLERLVPSLANIPQVIPDALYTQHLTGLFASRAEIVRTFAALCLARSHPNMDTWSAAAGALGLPPEVGTKVAEACATAQTADSRQVLRALHSLAKAMPNSDYRAREQAVRDLSSSNHWFTHWVPTYRPGTADTSKVYAITWLWTHTADGHVVTSPAWSTPPDAELRARYRRFTTRLTPAQQQGLREIARRHTEGDPLE